MDAAAILKLFQILLTLEPAAQAAITNFIGGMQGKSDAEVLAMDATTIAAMLKNDT